MGRYLTGHGVEIKYAFGGQGSDYEASSLLARRIDENIAQVEETDKELLKILESIDDAIQWNHSVWINKDESGAKVELSGLHIVSNYKVAKHVLSQIGITDVEQLRNKPDGFKNYEDYITSLNVKLVEYWEKTLGANLWIDDMKIGVYQLWDQIELHDQLIVQEETIEEENIYEFFSEY